MLGRILLILICIYCYQPLLAQPPADYAAFDLAAAKVQSKVIAWRRDFHAHPELGTLELRSSAIIADFLRKLGLEVKTGVAKTGVVGILRGGKPGPVIALRADMDALPIIETTNLPFASTVKTSFNGLQVGVMHACGHDAHMAILMGVAEVLHSFQSSLRGTVKFIFQPAEEGTPDGSVGGGELMVREGVLDSPKVEAIFGLHTDPKIAVGQLAYRPGGFMASVNDVKIIVTGRGAHGAYPWSSVDPILVSAEIINNLQAIVSRNVNITENPAVVTIGSIHGGTRSNIIPDQVELWGTLRALSSSDEALLIARVKQVATKTAESAGATAQVIVPYTSHYPVTYNDPALVVRMLPSLEGSAGKVNVQLRPPVLSGEDFSFYQQKIPGLFFFLGGMPLGGDPLKAPSQHTADFYLDESSFLLGVKTFWHLVIDYSQP